MNTTSTLADTMMTALVPLDVRLDTRRSLYPVVGATVPELRAVLAALGPVRAGRRFGAFTDWEIIWRYQHADGRGAYQIQAVTVEVRATITAPRWRPPRAAPAALVAAWCEYAAAIEVHEQGHVALAVATAKAIRARLMALPMLPSKTALADAANAVAEDELRTTRAREIAYDQFTCHGVTQGVVFPSENGCSGESAEPDLNAVNTRRPYVSLGQAEVFNEGR